MAQLTLEQQQALAVARARRRRAETLDGTLKPWELPDPIPQGVKYPWLIEDAPLQDGSPIRVQTPTGDIVEFPAGTSEAIMQAAMGREYGGSEPRPQEVNSAGKGDLNNSLSNFERFRTRFESGQIPFVNQGSPFGDMSVQFQKGLVQGTGSLISGPAWAGRWLGDRAADGLDYLTGGDTSAQRQALNKQLESSLLDPVRVGEAISNSTGIGDAATTAGDYANTIGQFIPGLLSGKPTKPVAGMMGLLGTTTASAVGSETAGQATQKTKAEPYARLGGALLGVGAPSVLRKAVTPNAISAERRAVVDALRKEGVPITAGQMTGGKALRYLESELGGGKAASLMEQQAEQFTKAALKRAGIDASRATPEVIDQAYTRLGNQFDDLASRTSVPLDSKLQGDLLDAVTQYQSIAGAPSPAAEQIMNRISELATKNGGVLSGEAYKDVMSRISKLTGSKGADAALKEGVGNIRNALDDAVERNLSGDLLNSWRETRGQYRNLKIIEQAATGSGEASAQGLLSPSRLQSAVVGAGRSSYARGKGDLAGLARSGEAVMKPLPDSGTAARTAARGLYTGLPGAIGAGIGSPGGPIGAIIGALTGAAVPYAAGRILLGKPLQRYLANQVLGRPSNVGAIRKALMAVTGAGANVRNPIQE